MSEKATNPRQKAIEALEPFAALHAIGFSGDPLVGKHLKAATEALTALRQEPETVGGRVDQIAALSPAPDQGREPTDAMIEAAARAYYDGSLRKNAKIGGFKIAGYDEGIEEVRESCRARVRPLVAAALSARPDQGRDAPEGWRALQTLRAAGWAVAVHNDYRLAGESWTFWLFTHPDGRWIKGEGRSDDEALAQALAASPAPLPPGGGWLPVSEAPSACHVLGCRFDHDAGEWVMGVILSPPSHPWTHWQMPPAPPALSTPTAKGEG